MKKLFVVLLILVASILFAQQSMPPRSGWSLIYNDTLGVGYRSIYSFNYNAAVDIPGAGTLVSKYADTTIYCDWDDFWGSATIWVELDSVTGYNDSNFFLYYQLYNKDIGVNTLNAAYAGYIDSATPFTLIDTVLTTKEPGSCYMNLSAYSGSHWSKGEGGRFYFYTADVVLVKLWLLRQ